MAFYGIERSWTPTETPFGPLTPQDLYRVLGDSWCAETCAPRMRAGWRPEDRTLGQCSVTAFLVQDLLGGEVWGIPLPEGGVHCFNLVQGKAFDLTCEQFHGAPLDYAHALPQRREEHFAKAEKYERYLLLKKRLLERLKREEPL